MKRLLDIDDLAKYLKLRKQTIYNWLHQGKISGIKLGSVWRFNRADIDRWLKSQHKKSTKEGRPDSISSSVSGDASAPIYHTIHGPPG